jgi:hypothetical protein
VALGAEVGHVEKVARYRKRVKRERRKAR